MSVSVRPTVHRVCNTAQLTALVSTARASGLNRVPDLASLDLDPEGLHIVCLMLGDHRGLPREPLHHRALALVKMVGQSEPGVMMLDVVDSDWRGGNWVQRR